MNTLDVSIIIVNYNTKELTRNCLRSVFAQTKDIRFEVIVSDNGSTDGSIEMIRAEFPQVILIENNANLGFGAANNRGLKIARGRYVFYLNSDTVLLNNAVKLFFDYWESSPDKERIGALGCVLQDEDGNAIHSGGRFPTPMSAQKKLFRQIISCYFYRFIPHKTKLRKEESAIGRIDYVTGADLFVKNGTGACFDEWYFMYCEEVDLQKRLRLNGKDSYIISGPEIIHLERASSSGEKSVVGYRFNTFSSIFNWISVFHFLFQFYTCKPFIRFLRLQVLFFWLLPGNYKKTAAYIKKLMGVEK